MSTILNKAQLSDEIDIVLGHLKTELMSAMTKHGPMHGPHEGYSVILEELDELWDEVKKKGGGRDALAENEALQVAAMACRYILDVLDR